MASGAGIIRARLLELADSLNGAVRRSFSRIAGNNGQLLKSLDSEARGLLSEFAERNRMTPEGAAIAWLGIQAKAYQQDKQAERLWSALTDREQQVVALCCLEYSDQEIADMLHIAYGTARTHLYNAIYKLGIHRKPELLFLLRNWDFSKFDREYPYG
jgi:DNA-binding CsgD family transcriptional regulator